MTKKQIKKQKFLLGIKECPGCDKDLPISDYYNKRSSDGKDTYCKSCAFSRLQKLKELPGWKEKEKLRNASRSLEQKKAIRIAAVERYRNDPTSKEKSKAQSKKWREANPDEYIEYCRGYYSKNRESIIQKNYKYSLNRKLKDPAYKIICDMRTRQGHVLKGKVKSGHTLDLLRMTPTLWKEYLEYTFWPGMSWANYGKKDGWEVDHIVPLASFRPLTAEQQGEAFIWSNTQALWRDDNKIKGKRLDWDFLESVHKLPIRLKRLDKTYWNVILREKE